VKTDFVPQEDVEDGKEERKGKEETHREEMLTEHRARDGASLCNWCELKHF
jgi:hypothetical protein